MQNVVDLKRDSQLTDLGMDLTDKLQEISTGLDWIETITNIVIENYFSTDKERRENKYYMNTVELVSDIAQRHKEKIKDVMKMIQED